MALTDRVMRQPTAADGATRVRRLVVQTLTTMEQSLAMMRQVVQRHGRSAIARELGADAEQLQQIYDRLRTCLADIDPACKPPELQR